jgi:hypothetical protein
VKEEGENKQNGKEKNDKEKEEGEQVVNSHNRLLEECKLKGRTSKTRNRRMIGEGARGTRSKLQQQTFGGVQIEGENQQNEKEKNERRRRKGSKK